MTKNVLVFILLFAFSVIKANFTPVGIHVVNSRAVEDENQHDAVF